MRLVINGRFLSQPITGVQRYAREIVAALDQRINDWPGWTLEMLVPPGTPSVSSYTNITVRHVGHLTGHAWEQLDLPRHVGKGVLLCLGNTAPLALLASARPVVVTVHDLSYRYFPSAYNWAFRAIYGMIIPMVMRRAAAVMTVSEAERQQILRYYPKAASRLTAVPNGGISVADEAARSHDLEYLRPYILYVGSFSKRKNFQGVLAVAQRLLAQRPNLRVVMIGGTSASLNKVDSNIQKLDDRMVFLGQIDDTDTLMSYYRSAELLLFPSFYESSGLPPVEAMANNCPVVASDIPALRERCGDAAIYCNPDSIDEIESAAARILDDPNLARDLARKGMEQSRRFTWQLCADDTMSLVQAAATSR